MAKQKNEHLYLLAVLGIAIVLFIGCQTGQGPVPPNPPPSLDNVPDNVAGQAINLARYQEFLTEAPELPFASSVLEEDEFKQDGKHHVVAMMEGTEPFLLKPDGNTNLHVQLTKPGNDNNRWLFYHMGYYYDNEGAWVPFTITGENKLSETTTGQKWIVDNGNTMLNIPVDKINIAGENYFVTYACRELGQSPLPGGSGEFKCLHRNKGLRANPGLWAIQSFVLDYTACTVDADCDSGMCGTTGLTQGVCVDNSDSCETGEEYYETIGKCQLPTCIENTECGTGSICASGQCVPEPVTEPGEVAFLKWNCASNSDCSTGNVCTTEEIAGPTGDSIPAGVCICDRNSCGTEGRSCIGFNDGKIPLCGDTCADVSACSDGLACVDNAFCGCTADAQCGEGYYCQNEHTNTNALPGGVCMQSTCGPEDICFGGRTCVAGQCVVECTDDTQCTTGQVCRDGGCVEDTSLPEASLYISFEEQPPNWQGVSVTRTGITQSPGVKGLSYAFRAPAAVGYLGKSLTNHETFTLSLAAKLSAADGNLVVGGAGLPYYPLVSEYTLGEGKAFILGMTDESVVFSDGSTDLIKYEPSSLLEGEWAHFTLVVNTADPEGDHVKLYHDATLVGTSGGVLTPTGDYSLLIGAAGYSLGEGGLYSFGGNIDEFKLFEGVALTSDQVKRLVEEDFPAQPVENGPVCTQEYPNNCNPCDANIDCLAGSMCSEGTCVPESGEGCTSSADCTAGEVCNAAGECVAQPTPECTVNDDCSTGKLCSEGACVQGVAVETFAEWEIDTGRGEVTNDERKGVCVSENFCVLLNSDGVSACYPPATVWDGEDALGNTNNYICGDYEKDGTTYEHIWVNCGGLISDDDGRVIGDYICKDKVWVEQASS
jgi:hypothetical protein